MAESLADQLRPVRDQMRSGRPEVKPIVQVTSEIMGTDPQRAAAVARNRILDWLRDKQQVRGIPTSAWDGDLFEIDVAFDRPVIVEAFKDLWALRYDNPDAREGGRYWRTEAVIGQLNGRPVLGIRLTVISRHWDIPFIRSVPAVVHNLVENPGLQDYGSRLTGTPTAVIDEEGVDALVALLELPARSRPVHVLSFAPDGTLPLNAVQLAKRTAGIAHVFTVTPSAAWHLSSRIGRELSVFGCALRTYAPGFDHLDAHWDDHSLATNDWLTRRFPDRRDFAQMLAGRAALRSVSIPDLEQRLPGFAKVRQELSRRRIESARQEKSGSHELLKLFEEDNSRLRDELQAAEDLRDELESLKKTADERRDQYARQNFNLKSRVEQLEHALSERGEAEAVELPVSYEELEKWAARYFAGKLVLLPRALRAAKKSEYKDIVLVAKGIRLLANEYRAMRLGDGAQPDYEHARSDLGVEVTSSGNEATLRQWPEEYEVAWDGEKRFLDMHLKRGTSREPKNCLRIYFFWDENSEQVVVGHLPSHLTNEAT